MCVAVGSCISAMYYFLPVYSNFALTLSDAALSVHFTLAYKSVKSTWLGSSGYGSHAVRSANHISLLSFRSPIQINMSLYLVSRLSLDGVNGQRRLRGIALNTIASQFPAG